MSQNLSQNRYKNSIEVSLNIKPKGNQNMAAFILRASKYARVGGIVVQAITLVVNITETIIKSKESSRQSAGDQHDPAEGE